MKVHETVPQGRKAVIVSGGRISRLAGPGDVFLRPSETVSHYIEVSNLPIPVYVDGVFPGDLPANADFSLWARFDPEEVAGKDRVLLHELLLLPSSRRNDQMSNDLREVLMRQVRSVLKAHDVPDNASPVERVMPALVGNPWYDELMKAVAEDMAPRLRRLGLILDRTRPVQITRIGFSELDRQSFTAARIAGVLRQRFPDLSDAKLIQVIAAFLGQPPMQVQDTHAEGVGDDVYVETSVLGPSGEATRAIAPSGDGAPPAQTGPAAGYDDFDLEIGPGKGRDYPVAVLRSPAGEARVTMRFPFDALRLESALDRLQIALLRSGGKWRTVLSEEQRAVRDFGQALFDALLTGEARNRYDVSLERAQAADRGLRVRLRFQAPDLAALPWEFLYDSRERDYLCLSTNTPLVRYLELPKPPQPLAVTPPLRILGLIAAPADLAELDVENERARVEKALAGLTKAGTVELHWLAEPTWRGLQRAMRRGPWHVLHFIGHGAFDAAADEGLVYLEDEQGKGASLQATQLGRLLADHGPLRLAVLNACEGARGGKRDIFSSTASILVGRGLSAVLAMQYEITDRAAIELARTLYEAVADGLPVDAAVAEARKAVSIAVVNTVEWGTPVLYMRSPDGVLFKVAPAPAAAVEKPIRVDEPPPVAGASRATPAPAQPEPKRLSKSDLRVLKPIPPKSDSSRRAA